MSAFVNSYEVFMPEQIKELENIINNYISNLKEDDFLKFNLDSQALKLLLDMSKNLYLKVEWIPFTEPFPFHDKNLNMQYDSLGYLQFEVEYFKGSPAKKKGITPNLLNIIPVMLHNYLVGTQTQIRYIYLMFDKKNPIFIYVISSETDPKIEAWDENTINKFKRELSDWTELYSGKWEDQREAHYDVQVKKNLSSRISELHFIHKNSGFSYIDAKDFERSFNEYVKQMILKPAGQIRAIKSAYESVNDSLDMLYAINQFFSSEEIEKWINEVRLLDGRVDIQRSLIQDEIDYKRKHHFLTILNHLEREFKVEEVATKVDKKIYAISDALNFAFQREIQLKQDAQYVSSQKLNQFFILGALAEITAIILAFLAALATGDTLTAVISGVVSVIIMTVLLGLVYAFIKQTNLSRKPLNPHAVDAVIVDNKRNVVLIRRDHPPFKGILALPGGFIIGNESPEQALIREVREETNLNIHILNKIGFYDNPSRDPRGTVTSTAFLCEIIGGVAVGEAISIKFMPIEEAARLDLAFDHEDIVRDALRYIE